MRKFDLNIPDELDGITYLHQASDVHLDRYARYMAHEHYELELNLGICGTAQYFVDGTPYTVQSGTLLWLFSDQTHLITQASHDFSMWIIFIKPDCLKELCTETPFRDLLTPNPQRILCTQLKTQNAAYLSQSAERLLNRDPISLHNATLRSTVLSAYHSFLHSNDDLHSGTTHPAVARATKLIQASQYDLPIDDISKSAGISKSQLSRLFKEQTGMTLVEYRHKFFLERFMYIYGSGKTWTILEASLEAGFGSYAQFYRVFLKQYGFGPHQYFKDRSQQEKRESPESFF